MACALDPLEMVDTGFFVPTDKLDRLATVYTASPEGKGLVPVDDKGEGSTKMPFLSAGKE